MSGTGSKTGEVAAEVEDEVGVKGAGKVICFEINLSYTFLNNLYS